MVNALHEGERLGMQCVQVFTKNQQQWAVKPLDEAMVRDWLAELRRLGWDRGGPDGRGGVVSHASYLINLASLDDTLWRRSVDLMTVEIERCEALAIPYLVHHPGAAVGGDAASGVRRIARAYGELATRTRGFKTISCFEGTVGAGSQLGGKFEELAALAAACADAGFDPARMGFCLDTCHMHAAGYDLSTDEAARKALAEFDRICGANRLKVLHLNDSKGKLGSRLDRHEHIGEGWVGGGASKHTGAGSFDADVLRRSGFVAVLEHAANLPKILETPKGNAPDGTPWDRVNLDRLYGLLGESAPAWTAGPGAVTTQPRPRKKPAAARAANKAADANSTKAKPTAKKANKRSR